MSTPGPFPCRVLWTLAAGLVWAACRPAPPPPLVEAAANGDVTAVERLIAGGARVDQPDGAGLRPLDYAARAGRAATIRSLARAGADVDAADPGGNRWTPLAHAIHRGQVASVRSLLDSGADPDVPFDEHRVTPLMMAAGYGYTEIVSLLLASGADAHARTVGGYTALAAAVGGTSDLDRFTIGSCQTDTVKALVAAAPDVTLPEDGFGRRARWVARLGGCAEVLRLVEASRRQGR